MKPKLTCFVLLISHALCAQTSFNENGQLIQLSPLHGKKPAFSILKQPIFQKDTISLAFPVLTNLDSAQLEEKKAKKKILTDKIDETLKRLEDRKDDLLPLLNGLWGAAEVNKVKQELVDLKDVIENESPVPGNIIHLKDAAASAKAHLFTTAPNLFTIKNNTATKAELWKKEVFNHFLIDYYNATRQVADARITKLKWSELSEQSQQLELDLKAAFNLLKVVYEQNMEFNADHYHAMQDFHNQLRRSTSVFSKMLAVLGLPWFKQWFWFRSGQLRFNPLDFTTDEFLDKNPDADITRAAIFDQYIDAVIDKYIQFDTAGKVEEFKKILSQKRTGRIVFSLKEAKEKAAAANSAAMKKLTQADALLNRVEILPEAPFYQFSAEKGFSTTANKRKYLPTPLRINEKKYLLVHNVAKGYRIGVTEEKTPVVNRSEFQAITDTLVEMGVTVAAFTASAMPYAASIATFLNKTTIPVNKSIGVPGGRGVPISVITVEEYLRQIIDSAGEFDQAVFDNTKASMQQKFGTSIVSNHYDYKDKIIQAAYIQSFKNEYEILFLQAKKDVFELVRQDSLLLGHMLEIGTRSTLPVKKLQAAKDTTPVYATRLEEVKGEDESLKKKITLFSYKGKEDTVAIAEFKYKTGPYLRFAVSAGLAYTITPFTQSTAKEENGQISITNSSQQYRMVAGVNIYLGRGLFPHDGRFPGRFTERIAAFVGVGIPKPLENVYIGLSYDLTPGLKLTGGTQLYKNNKYLIQNNKIVEDRLRYQFTGPFVALQIDAASLLSAFRIID